MHLNPSQMLKSADIYEDTILLFMGDNGGIHLRKGLTLLLGLVGTPCYFLSHFFLFLGDNGKIHFIRGRKQENFNLCFFCYSEFWISPNQANNKFILGKVFSPTPHTILDVGG